MPLLKGTHCYSGNRRNLKRLLVLLTLTLLGLASYGFLPSMMAHVDLYKAYSVLAKNGQWVIEGHFNLGKKQSTLNHSSLRTFQPENNSTGEPQKTLHVYDFIINEPDKCQGDVPFLVLLIAVERIQKEARQAIRQTWGEEDFVPGVKILRLFFLGKDIKWSHDVQQDLLKESQEYHDIIQQDYLDTYRNLTTKVLMGLHWVATYCPKASYVIKTDADMFVNTEYLIKVLLKPDQPRRQNYFTGRLMRDFKPIRNKWSKWYVSPAEYPENRYPWFCSGTGYVFSADLASKIVKVSPTVRLLYLEDVYVGLCLKKLGLAPVAPPKGSDFNAGKVQYSDCKYNKIVTSHRLNPKEIIHYWNELQQNKHNCTKG
ncbi:beta-1,3-galactosyltransferase 2-like [Hyperolius riggenbachi]|uniref:beta-1,3-galactosyltransferase 2-like n=1 Tax=Hyperolius riggenbachi TaxID=752182 RepID=UPI0035A3B6E0